MPIVEAAIQINAPAALVYAVSQDYRVRYDWDPFPESIEVVSGSMEELTVGTQVRVRSRLGMTMLVEFVQVAPPRRAAIRMIEGPALISKFAGSWLFDATGPDGTLVRFRYALATRPRWLAWAGDRIATAYFSRTARQRLQGLKRYCEALAGTPAQAMPQERA